MAADIEGRDISLGDGLPRIPERLLLAYARGEVLFICGAGISKSAPASLPDFRELVIDVYQEFDLAVHNVISNLPHDACNKWQANSSGLNSDQEAEVMRFLARDYDVVLGMLERRLDYQTRVDSSVRQYVAELLRSKGNNPADIHSTLMRLAGRSGVVRIVTTNFDLLLEAAGNTLRPQVETYSLSSIPRPTLQKEFAGVFHIHGALDTEPGRFSELVLSDQDFGEYYLRRRVVPDFIYDAARLFHLVLVGYSANDPPMRYLLNAVAADQFRFSDIKERFIFCGNSSDDPVKLADWRNRGIIPIRYDSIDDHAVLGKTLERWAELSPIVGNNEVIEKEIKRILQTTRATASEADRDLFDHLLRRSSINERDSLVKCASDARADSGWLDAILDICREKERDYGSDSGMFLATVSFLKKRLTELDTINWALSLKPDRRVERMAVTELLNGPGRQELDEPWKSAWRLIEESWSQQDPSISIENIQRRLHQGDRSGAIISAIVKLVMPRLKVEPKPINLIRRQSHSELDRPRNVYALLSVSITSGNLINPNKLQIANFTEENEDLNFLSELTNGLDAALIHGLDIARRIDRYQESFLSRLVYRVSYTGSDQTEDGNDGEDEPDAFHLGIAPATKLLHAVVERIADLDPMVARPVVQCWRLRPSSYIHIRLWAAAALNDCLVSAEDVGEFLIELDDSQFWGLDKFPEIAQLRASRFANFNTRMKIKIIKRIRKLPPDNLWWNQLDASIVEWWKPFWAVRELKRIEIAGSNLLSDERSWLKGSVKQLRDLMVQQSFSEEIGINFRDSLQKLDNMEIDDGFPGARKLCDVPTGSHVPYDALQGTARLEALEENLPSDRNTWYNDTAESAKSWLEGPGKATIVLNDLESVENGSDMFPTVWKFFCQAHAPKVLNTTEGLQHDFGDEAKCVLCLLEKLSYEILSAAIEEISSWLERWHDHIHDYIIASPLGLRVWLRIWPIAVEVTNASDCDQKLTLSDINSPTGKLVDVFLSALASLNEVAEPFAAESNLRKMRNAIVNDATGRSRLIVQYQMIKFLGYFLKYDRHWTEEHLINPLLVDDDISRGLWNVIAQRTHDSDVLEIIGDEMANRATDLHIPRETRHYLVSNLVFESLEAFRVNREPVVSNTLIQQMLRSLDDESRAAAAQAINHFIDESLQSGFNNQMLLNPAELFQSAVAPFLQNVWPQERSLTTPGVSKALAKLPATSGEAFAYAVATIERFLVPFDCRSMLDDYGLRETEFSIIDDEEKASALLQLLDLTVSTLETAMIPRDLTDALDKIRSIAETLVDSSEFRRLSTAARR